MKTQSKILALFIAILMLFPALVSCSGNTDVPPVETTHPDVTTIPDEPDEPKEVSINGIPITEYTIVYSESGLDFNKRAAEYISKQIEVLTGTPPAVVLDTEAEDSGNEILIGITNRGNNVINTEDFADVFKFASASQGDSIILYGEEYMIAGAAYDLANKLTDERSVTVTEEVTVGEPVFEDPKNIIYVIGDGMGFNSLKLGEQIYESGEHTWWETKSGYHQYAVADRLPNKGQNYTHSYDNDVTDSAAGGTALATGYKTYNGVIGLNSKLEPVKNLTELAQELGRKTAVLTSDEKKGATPSAFSIHVNSRYNSDGILAEYDKVTFDYVIEKIFLKPENELRTVLDDFDSAENGVFIMFEEAKIDAEAHGNDEKGFYRAYTRLNSALRVFLEYMMYNPDTVLVLTADHETGRITLNEETGKYEFTYGDHTQVNVPLYGIGKGTEFIDGKTFDNTGVAKFIAQLMGVDDFGDPTIEQLTSNTGLETLSEDELEAIRKEREEAEKIYNQNN